jgi:hypothetical protein
MYSEIVWTVLYTYTVVLGSVSNDLNILGSSFYILALAGIEFSIGILLLIFFKNSNKSLSIENNTKNETIFLKKTISSNKMYWNLKNK